MKNYLGFFKTNRTLLGSVLVVSVGFLSVQVVNAGSPVIKGCVSKVSGLVRIASKCAKNENWSRGERSTHANKLKNRIDT